MRASPAASNRRRVPSRFRRRKPRGVVALAAAVGAGDVGEREVDEGVGWRQRGAGSARVQRMSPVRPSVVTRWPAAAARGRRSGRRCRWRR